MDLSREERETIVRTSDADDGWLISTASPKYIRKFTKLGYRQSVATSDLDGYKDFTIPRNLVSFRRPRKK
jgi:hypothetical protein